MRAEAGEMHRDEGEPNLCTRGGDVGDVGDLARTVRETSPLCHSAPPRLTGFLAAGI